MKNSILLIIFSFLITNNVFAKEINNEDILLINSLRNYENDAHVSFQEELHQSSNDFIRTQSEKFVDNETGFFKLWTEAFRFFQSDTKKNARWKSRVEKYFRATEYIGYIEKKESIYANTINIQRQELLGKLHNKNNKLFIKSKGIDPNLVSGDEIKKVVEKVNKLVLTEVIPEVIESLLFPLIISIIGVFFGIFLGKATKGILFIFSIGISIWLSVKYSNELESQINKSFALENKQHLSVLPVLTENTTLYYNEIINKLKKQ